MGWDARATTEHDRRRGPGGISKRVASGAGSACIFDILKQVAVTRKATLECRVGGGEGEEWAGSRQVFFQEPARFSCLLVALPAPPRAIKAWPGPPCHYTTPVESRRRKVSNLPGRNMWQLMLHKACLFKLEDSDPWLRTGDITIM